MINTVDTRVAFRDRFAALELAEDTCGVGTGTAVLGAARDRKRTPLGLACPPTGMS